MQHDYTIPADDITLRPMSATDSEVYRRLRNREDNRNFFFDASEISAEQQRAWYERYLSDQASYMFSVYETNANAFIGGIGLYDIDRAAGTAEVGRILIDRQIAAGHGYGAQAIVALSRFALQQMNLRELTAYIYHTNLPSRKSFAKAGYEECALQQDNQIVRMCFTGAQPDEVNA